MTSLLILLSIEIILFLIFCCSLLSFPTAWQLWASVTLALGLGATAYFSPKKSCYCLVLILSLLPLLGNSVVLCSSSVCFFAFLSRKTRSIDRENFPLILTSFVYSGLVLASLVPALDRSLDIYLLYRIYIDAGWDASLQFLAENAYRMTDPLRAVAPQLLFAPLVVLFTRVFSNRESRQAAVSFLLLGVLAAPLVLLAQYFSLSGFLSANFSEFWQRAQRYPASYTDPNAYGVFTALLIPLFGMLVFPATDKSSPPSGKRSAGLFLILGLLSFGASLWSGSRTLLLGVLIYTIYRLAKGKRGTRVAGVFFLLFIVLVPTGLTCLQSSMPIALERLGETLQSDRFYAKIENRIQFSRIGWESFRTSAFFRLRLRFFSESAGSEC